MKFIIVVGSIVILINIAIFFLYHYDNIENKKDWKPSVSETCRNPNFWTAISAINTFFAVVCVLVIPFLISYFERPIVEISLANTRTSNVKFSPNTTDSAILFLPLSIKNKGVKVAEKAKAYISAVATYEDEKWVFHPDWSPAPLFLAESFMEGKIIEEFDLISERPYIIDLGRFGDPEHMGAFTLIYSKMYKNQKESYPNNQKHCFEISLFAKDIQPTIAYIIVEWRGEYSSKPKEISERLMVQLRKKSPW